MPTTLPRVQVTITPNLARSIERGRSLWPDQPASQLVATLAELGASTLQNRQIRRDAVAETAGVLRDAYPAGYLQQLREDWE